jgi:hypothetical protein
MFRRLLAVVVAGIVSMPSALQATPTSSQVMRISTAQASNGYPLQVTYDLDQLIKFQGDRIVNVWGSHNLLFLPRFTQGGSLIVLQATATPDDMKLLSELGRPLGTLTVELESGEAVVFNLSYTPQARNQILTVYRAASLVSSRLNDSVLPSILSRYQQPVAKPGLNRVSQDGFFNPLSAQKITTSLPSSGVNPEGNKNRTDLAGYWLLEQGKKNPQAWQDGPDAGAYRAFFEILERGYVDGASFDLTLQLAQRLSGVSDGNLVWLTRRLVNHTSDTSTIPQKAAPSVEQTGSDAQDPVSLHNAHSKVGTLFGGGVQVTTEERAPISPIFESQPVLKAAQFPIGLNR